MKITKLLNAAIFCFLSANVLTIFGQMPETLSPAAKAEYARSNYAPCIEEFTKIIASQPNNDAALVERARCYYQSLAKTKDAAEIKAIKTKGLADAEKAVSLNPKNALAYNTRGIFRPAESDAEGAIADYTKAIELDPRFIKPYMNRASVYRFQKKPEAAIADYSKALELDGANKQALEQRANLYYSVKKYDAAAADYTRLIALDAKNAQWFVKRAESYHAGGTKWKQIPGTANAVADDYRRAMEIDPANAAIYNGAGKLCFEDLDVKFECKWIYEKFIDVQPQNADAHLGYAQAIGTTSFDRTDGTALEWRKRAAQSYQKAVDLSPGDIKFYNELANYYGFILKDYANALAVADRAVQKFPSNPFAYAMRGNAVDLTGDTDAAVAALSRAVELSPTYSYAYARLGELYGRKAQPEKAIVNLNKALELDENNGSAYLLRGLFYFDRKRFDESLHDLNEAVSRNMMCAKVYRGRTYGELSWAAGERSQSGKYFALAKNDFWQPGDCAFGYIYLADMLARINSQYEAGRVLQDAEHLYRVRGWDTAPVAAAQERVDQSRKLVSPSSLGKSETSGGATLLAANPSESARIREVIERFKTQFSDSEHQIISSGTWRKTTDGYFDASVRYEAPDARQYTVIAVSTCPGLKLHAWDWERNPIVGENIFTRSVAEQGSVGGLYRADFAVRFKLGISKFTVWADGSCQSPEIGYIFYSRR